MIITLWHIRHGSVHIILSLPQGTIKGHSTVKTEQRFGENSVGVMQLKTGEDHGCGNLFGLYSHDGGDTVENKRIWLRRGFQREKKSRYLILEQHANLGYKYGSR